MIYFVIFALLFIVVWMSYEFNRAPYMDESGNIIKKRNDSTVESNDTHNKGV